MPCLEPYYPWQRLVQDAVGENELNKLAVKIRIAEAEIFERIHKFKREDDGKEEQALFNALETMRSRGLQSPGPR
jgi:hypothetical protein